MGRKPVFFLMELKDIVPAALFKTSNTLAPGPDRISGKIIKWVDKSVLGEYFINNIVDNMLEAKIPRNGNTRRWRSSPNLTRTWHFSKHGAT